MEKQVNPQPLYPMKWHKFLIYFALWAGALSNFGYGIQIITGKQYLGYAQRIYSNYPGLKIIDVIYGAFLIFISVYSIVTRFKLAEFKAAGPKYLINLYILNAVASIIYILAIVSTTPLSLGSYGSQLVGQIIGPIIMVAANKTYYDRRTELFVN